MNVGEPEGEYASAVKIGAFVAGTSRESVKLVRLRFTRVFALKADPTEPAR